MTTQNPPPIDALATVAPGAALQLTRVAAAMLPDHYTAACALALAAGRAAAKAGMAPELLDELTRIGFEEAT